MGGHVKLGLSVQVGVERYVSVWGRTRGIGGGEGV